VCFFNSINLTHVCSGKENPTTKNASPFFFLIFAGIPLRFFPFATLGQLGCFSRPSVVAALSWDGGSALDRRLRRCECHKPITPEPITSRATFKMKAIHVARGNHRTRWGSRSLVSLFVSDRLVSCNITTSIGGASVWGVEGGRSGMALMP